MLNNWWLAIRPKTLSASIAPVLLGSALAAKLGTVNEVLFVVALCCALSLQIAVNLANDWFDSRSGVDTAQRLGPVRVSQSKLINPRQMQGAITLVTVVAVISGAVLVYHAGWPLFYCGIAALIAVFAYSGGPYPLASYGLGEITVLVFFGLLAVAGNTFLHLGNWPWQALAYGVSSGLISAAIMLVNNLRDIATDQQAGKRTLAVRIGDKACRKLYRILLLLALLVHLIAAHELGWFAALPLLFCAWPYCNLVTRITTTTGRHLNPLLANTAQFGLLYCVSAAISLLM